ncbi:Sulfate permease [Paramyrothecium foliicola]|nr:Sulfate permease [Paramyrothecium foliicola]
MENNNAGPDCNKADAEREPLLQSRLSSDAMQFVESSPTVSEWLVDQVPSSGEVAAYCSSLFPFTTWIRHYNAQWAAGDVVAGITIGAVVVPQGMAYAMLANLEPQYGLYSSFVGVMVYWFFGTSKDISIGPVAVLSTVVGNVIDSVRVSHQDIPGHAIASALSFVAGCFVLVLGLVRFGFVIDLIPITSLSAFMTGSAITIVVSQLPALLGVSGFSNRDSPYSVLTNTITHLPEAGPDAVIGLSALAFLYIVKHGLTRAAERVPQLKRHIFFMNTMRTVFVIAVYTLASWVVNRQRSDNSLFGILGPVPSGLPLARMPRINADIVSELSAHLPAVAIIMLVEHVAISKSFGRVNNYNIDPSQEMVAIGVTNILGSIFGAYPSTGSFSRTAIQSKAGVRTPAAGVISGLVVLLTTYFLTDIFFFIPTATLAAVIIHAVSDLITPTSTIQQFWSVSPLEVLIFFLGVLVSIFSHIENGLYTTVLLSGSIFVYRILKAQGRFLGRVRVRSLVQDRAMDDGYKRTGTYGSRAPSADDGRNVFLPLDHEDGSNPIIPMSSPYPGIFIYRFSEGFNYPNANSTLDHLVGYIYENTRRGRPEFYQREGDRPWNNPGLRQTAKSPESFGLHRLPTLKAIILDLSSVNNVDVTSVQRLIDVRNQLDAYSAPNAVDWHFACINNRWTKRALSAGGFGVPYKPADGGTQQWTSIFSVADIGGPHSAATDTNLDHSLQNKSSMVSQHLDEELGNCEDDLKERASVGSADSSPREALNYQAISTPDNAAIHGLDKPLFHVDLTSAVQSAILNVEARSEGAGQTFLHD